MSKNTKDASEVDYQVNGPTLDLESSLGDDEDGFIEFQFETRAIFHRLAEDIYESDEAGIREPLSNAITAAQQAERWYNIPNPVIEITVRDGDTPRLILKDNGIGIETEVLEKVLTVIGNTTNLDDGSVSGKYGMGFLACYKLVGTDGGFLMHTRSRETEEAMSGIWKPGGFDMDTENEFENPFETDDGYGTMFDFHLKDGITRGNIRSWVQKHAEWATVPVIYREYDSDGREVYNEDYGVSRLKETYSEDAHVLTFENEYFSAYCSPEADSRTVLLNSPIERNYSIRGLEWSVDIRFKNENDVVVWGPNKGYVPVKDKEYREMREERKEKYIPEADLTPEDITLPGPTGTRDTLSRNVEFWEQVRDTFKAQYYELARGAFNSLKTTDFLDLSEKDRELIVAVLDSDDVKTYGVDQIQSGLARQNISVSEETAQTLHDMMQKYSLMQRDTVGSGFRYDRNTRLWEVFDQAGEDGRVFTTCKPSDRKVQVVFGDNDNNQIIKVDSTDEYDVFDAKFDWKPLTYIGSGTIDEFDVSEELKERFRTNSESRTSKKKTEMTVYHGDLNDDEPERITPETISKRLDPSYTSEPGTSGSIGRYGIGILIVCPRTGNENVTDNKGLANHRIGVASCTTEQWEYLQDVKNVVHADEYFDKAAHRTFPTPDGEMTINSFKEMNTEGRLVFHVLPESTIELFRDLDIMEGAQDFVQTKIRKSYGGQARLFPDAVYAPVTQRELDLMRPAVEYDTAVVYGDSYYDKGTRENIKQDTKVYAHARLPKWKDTTEIEAFESFDGTLNDGGKELVNTLSKLHDNGLSPDSQ